MKNAAALRPRPAFGKRSGPDLATTSRPAATETAALLSAKSVLIASAAALSLSVAAAYSLIETDRPHAASAVVTPGAPGRAKGSALACLNAGLKGGAEATAACPR